MNNLLILLLATIPLVGFSQKVKYKDVFPVIVSSTDEEAKNRLRSFLLLEPDHPNTNLRLAMMYERGYRSSDALTEYAKVMGYAEQAKLRYLKSRLLVDAREVSRNEEYYAEFASSFDRKGRPEVDYSTVQQKIINGYDSAELMLQKLPPIYRNFTAAVNKYGEAHNLFFDINNRYQSLDDLFMLYDENLHNELLELKSAMDSSVFYFGRYRDLINKYPVNQYDQEIKLVPVTYYRLDGLAELSTFLHDKVLIWNYADWVDTIFKVVNEDINKIRKDIVSFEAKLNENLKKLQDRETTEVIDLDRELTFQIRKYDYKSLVVDLMQYKNFKQQLIKKENQKIFYDTASQKRMLSKYNFYSELIKQQKIADSLLSEVIKNNSSEKRRKYHDFIEDHYQGKQGLELYLEQEKSKINKQFSIYQLTVRNDLLNELQQSKNMPQEWLKYQDLEVPLFENGADSTSLAEGKPIAAKIDYRADSSRYIAGYKPAGDGERNIAFLAYVNASNQLLWMKEFDISIDSGATDASSVALDLEITKDGCGILLNSTHLENPLSVNTFLYLNDEGNEKINIRLETELFPRKIIYDQLNNRFIIVMKGSEEQQQIFDEEPLHLVAINSLGDKLWERQINYAGSFESIINHKQGYLISGNYTAIKDINGKLFATRKQLQETNSFVIKLSPQGDVNNIVAFEKPFSYYITSVFKINDENINFFGFKDKYKGESGGLSYENEDIIHLMIDENLKQIQLNR